MFRILGFIRLDGIGEKRCAEHRESKSSNQVAPTCAHVLVEINLKFTIGLFYTAVQFFNITFCLSDILFFLIDSQLEWSLN